MVSGVIVPEWLQRFVDDASMFPPGNLPLAQAVQEHRAHREAEYGALVGGFVVSEGRLPELVDLLDDLDHDDPLGINLVVTGGVGAIEPAVRWATRAGSVRLDAVEYALRTGDLSGSDLPQQAQRLCQMVDNLGADLGLDPAETPVYAEPPRLDGPPTPGWLGALDELASRELRLKFRTGGVTPDAFPGAASLATSIDAALDRELPFKCTAGLHHAVAHDQHHGFLNILAATRACLDGGDPVEALTRTDDVLAGLDADALTRTRRWFTSFGSCSVLEPHEDLVELGLL